MELVIALLITLALVVLTLPIVRHVGRLLVFGITIQTREFAAWYAQMWREMWEDIRNRSR